MFPILFSLTFGLMNHAQAHGIHEQQPIAPDADWATRHMAGMNNLMTAEAQNSN